MTDYTVLPEGFTFERPAVLDGAFTVASVRGICVEYHHVVEDGGIADYVAVYPDQGRPSYRLFPSWIAAHDYACNTARREVLDELGHDCPRTGGWEYGAACGEGCEVESPCRCSAVPCGGACLCTCGPTMRPGAYDPDCPVDGEL